MINLVNQNIWLSEFEIEEVDVSELGLYLVLNLPKAELPEEAHEERQAQLDNKSKKEHSGKRVVKNSK